MGNPFSQAESRPFGIQSISAGVRKEVEVLPPGAPLHWFDFSDLTQMFTDTAGTMPVVNNGDLIARINNKGTDGTALIQTTPSDRMELDLAFNSVPSALASDVGGGTGSIAETIASGVATDFSYAVIAALENTSLAEIVISWPPGPNSPGLEFRHLSAGTLNMLAPATSVIASINPAIIDVYAAGVKVSRVAGTQQGWYSLDSGSQATAIAFTAIAAASQMIIGAGTFPGGFDFQGHIGGVIIWPDDQTANIEAIQDYVTSRFGVVWA